MQYEWIAGVLVISCIVFLIVGLVTLAKKPFFIAWLRGTAGFACLLVAGVLALLSINIFSYQNLVSESPVATISFAKSGEQLFRTAVILPGGEEREYRIAGDLWQIDAKIIKWLGPLAAAGLDPGYKLDRLQGRYIALEDEQQQERTVYGLSEPDIGFDVWEMIQSSKWLPWVDAAYGSATYLPMADGAIYSVSLTKSGLISRPVNERAEVAVNEWH